MPSDCVSPAFVCSWVWVFPFCNITGAACLHAPGCVPEADSGVSLVARMHSGDAWLPCTGFCGTVGPGLCVAGSLFWGGWGYGSSKSGWTVLRWGFSPLSRSLLQLQGQPSCPYSCSPSLGELVKASELMSMASLSVGLKTEQLELETVHCLEKAGGGGALLQAQEVASPASEPFRPLFCGGS